MFDGFCCSQPTQPSGNQGNAWAVECNMTHCLCEWWILVVPVWQSCWNGASYYLIARPWGGET